MFEKELNIPTNHSLKLVSSENRAKKSYDIDTYKLEEFNENNELIAKYIIEDSTCMCPPQKQSVTYTKDDLITNTSKDGIIK